MFYKVKKGTPLYKQLIQLQDKIYECNEATRLFVESLGYKEFRYSTFDLAGGLSSVIIPSGKPPGWRKAFTGLNKDHDYMPARIPKNAELNERIKNLPKVTNWEFNRLVGYEDVFGNPGIYFVKDMVLLTFSERMLQKLKPQPGMKEITRSEFEKEKLSQTEIAQ